MEVGGAWRHRRERTTAAHDAPLTRRRRRDLVLARTTLRRTERAEARTSPWLEALVATLPAWLAARAAVFAAYALGRIAVDQLGVARPPSLVDGVMGWDAHHYRTIAEHGYDAVADGYRFFPLFPMAVRAVTPLTFGSSTAAALLLANVAAIGLGVVFHRVVRSETGDARTATFATWLLLAGPAAVPLAMGYAEAVGLIAAVGAIHAARRGRWGIAAAAGAVVGGTWSIGWLLAAPLAVEAVRRLGAAGWPERTRRGLAVGAPLGAAAAYLLWVEVATGDGWGNAVAVQTSVYDRTLRDPFTSILRTADELLFGHHATGVVFPWAVLAVVLLVVAFRRLPFSYGVWALAIFLVAISAENVDSFERYLLRAFPLAVAGALVLRREWQQRAAIALGLSGLTIYATVIFLGAKVP